MNSIVHIVDDHPDGIEFLRYLCASVDLSVSVYQDPHQFLAQLDPRWTGCLLIDLRMPQMGGLELLDEVRKKRSRLTTVILTNHADVTACRDAFQHGAFDFVQKDANPHLMLETIQKAIRDSETKARRCERVDSAHQCLETLTSREREVLDLLTGGKSLKDIASHLSITVQTASKHRTRVLQNLMLRTKSNWSSRFCLCRKRNFKKRKPGELFLRSPLMVAVDQGRFCFAPARP